MKNTDVYSPEKVNSDNDSVIESLNMTKRQIADSERNPFLKSLIYPIIYIIITITVYFLLYDIFMDFKVNEEIIDVALIFFVGAGGIAIAERLPKFLKFRKIKKYIEDNK